MLINLKIILKFMKKGYNRKLHKKTIYEKIYDFKLFILCNINKNIFFLFYDVNYNNLLFILCKYSKSISSK